MIKTVSLETAKLLKENGFPYKSSFSYCLHANTGGSDYVHMVWDGQGLTSCGTQYLKVYAPTTDELLEVLPVVAINVDSEKRYCVGCKRNGFENRSLPEALAQCWLWLKKEGLNG